MFSRTRLTSHDSVANGIAIAATAIAGVMCGWLAILHFRMIGSPAPQEMREGAVIWLTRLLLEGRNLYANDQLPASTNLYGIVYHLVVLPFARVFGNGYTVHRAVSGAAILCGCVLFYRLLRRERVDRLLAVAGTLLFYTSSIYFVAPLARPDSLGSFLAILAITILFHDNLTWPRFGIGVLIGVLALLTKLYFVFPLFIVAAHVLLFVSPARGIAYAAVAIVVCAATLLGVTIVYPAYITTSVITHINAEAFYDAVHMRRQSLDWILYSLPALVALAILAAGSVVERANVTRRQPGIFAFAAAVNASVFVGWIGGHPGSHMTYLFHLETPLLLLAVLPSVSTKRGWPRALVAAALPIAVAVGFQYFPMTFQRFAEAEATFGALESAIAAHRNVIGSTEIAGPLALSNREVFDSGQSQYFRDAATEWRLPGLLPASTIQHTWEQFTKEIDNGIVERRFDLIVCNRRNGPIPAALVGQHYVRTATLEVDFPWANQRWPLDLWQPRVNQH